MDLKQLNPKEAADEGRWMNVIHPVTGEWDGEMRIKLAGADSQRFVRASRDLQDRRLQRLVNKGAQAIKSKEMERRGIELLAAVTLEWEHIDWDGVPLPCNFDSAVRLYTELSWLKEQVDQFVGDRKNYLSAAEEIDEAADEYEQALSVTSPEAHLQKVEENL